MCGILIIHQADLTCALRAPDAAHGARCHLSSLHRRRAKSAGRSDSYGSLCASDRSKGYASHLCGSASHFGTHICEVNMYIYLSLVYKCWIYLSSNQYALIGKHVNKKFRSRHAFPSSCPRRRLHPKAYPPGISPFLSLTRKTIARLIKPIEVIIVFLFDVLVLRLTINLAQRNSISASPRLARPYPQLPDRAKTARAEPPPTLYKR